MKLRMINIFALIPLFFMMDTFAIPAFKITTANNPITVAPSGTTTITYVVQNVSGVNMTQMKYFPPALTTFASTGNCGNTLANGASCNVVLTLTAPSQTGTLLLDSLGVCGFNGRICSTPNKNNRVTVHVGPTPIPPVVAYKVYIANTGSSTVSVIDTLTDTVTATPGTGASPLFIAVMPNGNKVYTSDVAGGSVSVIDAVTDTTLGAPIAVGGSPFAIAVTPNNAEVYVTDNSNPGNVIAISTVTDTVTATIPVGIFPFSLVITPDSLFVYVTNDSSNNVSIISTATHTQIGASPVAVGGGPDASAITPSGDKVITANSASSNASIILTASNTVVATLAMGAAPPSNPTRVAVTPNGNFAYVTNGGLGAEDVTSITLATNTVRTQSIPMGANTGPNALAITPNSAKVLVVNPGPPGSATVKVIDVATDTVIASIPMGNNPQRIAITPDGAKAYVTNGTDGTVSVIDVTTDTLAPTSPIAVGANPTGVVIRP